VANRSQSRQHFYGEGKPGQEHSNLPRALTAPTARSLEYWAQTRPDAPALVEAPRIENGRVENGPVEGAQVEPTRVENARTLSYREWNDYADQLADTLVDAGLVAGDVAALRAHTRLEWLVVACALAKIDAILLPIDPQASPRNVRRILIDAGAVALICDDVAPDQLSPQLTGLPFKLRASIDTPAAGFRNLWDMFPAVARPRFARSQPATITYRTQSSGALRAVSIPQRCIALASVSKTPTPDDGVSLMTLGAHHAFGTKQMWQALAAGRRMALLPHYEPLAALQAIESCGVTQWMDFPDTFQRLTTLDRARIRSIDLSSLRSIGVGGGGAPGPLKTWLVETFGPIVTQSFGLPETGLIARLPAEAPAARPGSCGRPTSGVIVEIRNLFGQRLPPNSIGEVWARTPESIERRLIGFRDEDAMLDENDFVRTGVSGRMDEDGFLFLDPLAEEAHADAAMLSRHVPIRLTGRPLQR
jgi:long-chain acyl-CoA synthetase